MNPVKFFFIIFDAEPVPFCVLLIAMFAITVLLCLLNC
jgi:hypothetical protein